MNKFDKRCEGMRKFDSPRMARQVATRRRRKGDSRRKQVAYRCKACGYWHIGAAEG